MDFESKQPIYKIGSDDVVINKRGEYTVGFKLIEPEVFSSSNDDYSALNELFTNILAQLPDFTVIHKQDWFFVANYKPDPRNLKDYLSEKFEFSFNEKPFKKHESYLFITKTTKSILKRSTGTSILAQNIIEPKLIDENIYANFLGTMSSVEQVINRSGLAQVIRLKRSDYLPTENNNGLLNQFFTLSKQNIFADFDFTNGIKIGNKHAVIYPISDLSQYPDNVSLTKIASSGNKFPFSYMYNLGMGLNCNHIYNQYIFKDDPDHAIDIIARKGKHIFSFSKESEKNATTAEQIQTFVKQATETKVIVRHHCNVIAWGDQTKVSEAGGLIQSAYESLGFRAKQETFDASILYWAGVPGNGADIPKDLTSTMYSDQAFCFSVFETAYKDSHTAIGIKLTDRINKIPLYVDLDIEPRKRQYINNINKFIIGSSGSGKSVFTNEMVHSNILQGNRCVIIDRGNSYRRTNQYLNYINNNDDIRTQSVYMEYTEDTPLSFNPFHISSLDEATFDKVEKLMGMLFSLWLNEAPTPAQESIMEQTIRTYFENCFENNIEMNLNSFYEYLREYANRLKENKSTDLKYFDFDNFRTVLRRYYKGGLYENLLNAAKPIDILNTPLIVFELDSIRDNETLLGIVTMMIMTTYIDVLDKAPEEQLKYLILDEAWKALLHPQMAVFIKWCVKTLRKHNGALITVTQELEDLINSEMIKNALIANMPTKIIMDISGYKGSVDFVAELLGLTELEKSLVNSLNRDIPPDENFREVVIKFGTASTKVYANRISPHQLAAYNTDPEKVAQINNLEKKYGGNMQLAIEQFVENQNTKS